MSIYFVEATDKDCDLLFNWSNDEMVRANSFNTYKIKYEDHVKWFNSKLGDDSVKIYICYSNGIPVGQVRIQLQEDGYLISYSIDSNHRGKGFGEKILKLLEDEISSFNGNTNRLIGYVKYSNISSQKVFEKLAYTKVLFSDSLQYYKDIK